MQSVYAETPVGVWTVKDFGSVSLFLFLRLSCHLTGMALPIDVTGVRPQSVHLEVSGQYRKTAKPTQRCMPGLRTNIQDQ